ncbi:MAG: protein BatD [Candidatus Omnitrophica bacterium]|nr:protein BatD [Candidatus Omnitrophota bacterium]
MKIRKVFAFLAIYVGFVFVLTGVAFTALPEVTITFDRQTVSVGEEVHLTIRIEGSQGESERPRLPSIESFTTFYTGRSTQTKDKNGQTISVSEFRFVLVPNAVGKFTFPAVEVEVEGQVFRTSSVQFEVMANEGAAGTAAGSPANSSIGVSHLNGSSTGQPPAQPPSYYQIPKTPPQGFVPPGADPNIFLKAWVDKTVAYPNEPIVLTYSLYTRQDTQYEGFSEEPVITGFWIEQFATPEKLGKTVVQIGGKRYVRADVRKMTLFPQGSGEYSIQPGSVKVSVEEQSHYESFLDEFFDDSFFSRRIYAKKIPKILATYPISITVKPFPDQGKPENFSGATGRFTFTGTIDRRAVKQNEPVTLTLTIEGEGNIETMEKPRVPELKNFQTYESDVSTQMLDRKDSVMGRKTFQTVFIPELPGNFELPSVEFSFFDPQSEKYTTLRTEAFQIRVTPGEAGPVPKLKSREEQEQKKGVELEARDIFFIKDRLEKSLFERLYPRMLLILMGDGAATILALILLLLVKRREALDTNVALKRRIEAPRAVRRGLRKMGKVMKDSSREGQQQFCEIAQKTLMKYLSDQMNVSAHSLTVPMVEDALKERGEPEETIERLKSFHDICNQVRFTNVDINDEKKEELFDTVQIISKSIARHKK